MSTVTPDDNERSKGGHEGRVAELRQQLKEAKVEATLQKQTATMHRVTHDQVEAGVVKLGPAAYAKVEFEGCRVKALIDTGSPATIVALDCLLDALVKGCTKDQTPAEWEVAVKR